MHTITDVFDTVNHNNWLPGLGVMHASSLVSLTLTLYGTKPSARARVPFQLLPMSECVRQLVEGQWEKEPEKTASFFRALCLYRLSELPLKISVQKDIRFIHGMTTDTAHFSSLPFSHIVLAFCQSISHWLSPWLWCSKKIKIKLKYNLKLKLSVVKYETWNFHMVPCWDKCQDKSAFMHDMYGPRA